MKVTSAILCIVGVLSPFAQAGDPWNLNKVPNCAHECLAKAITESGCEKPNDLSCICLSEKFKEKATPCIKQSCAVGDAYVPLILSSTP